MTAAVDFAGFDLCQGAMRTSEYRRELRARGVDLTDRDVDHVLPHSLGGANHPANYQVLSSHTNRSLGNGLAAKFDAVPMALLQGVVVSALMRLQCANDPRAFGR